MDLAELVVAWLIVTERGCGSCGAGARHDASVARAA
jgi:hypothetical protein